METKRRSLVKAIVWNAIGLVMMAQIGYIATGSLAAGGTMAAVNTVLGFTLYLAYERVWAQIGWGRHV